MKSCIENNPTRLRRLRYLMNTFCQIEAAGGAYLEEAVEAAFAELKRIENVFSRYITSSQICRINKDAYERPIKVDEEVFGLLKHSFELSELTAGTFDITVGAAIDLWRWAESRGIMPTHSQIEQVREAVGRQNVVLDDGERSVRFARQGVRFDLGAFAKGYAIDRAVHILKEYGVKEAQLNLGGHIHILDSQPQTIAIRNPVSSAEISTAVDLMNSSISTSAGYERYFTIHNRRFCHLINPCTCLPVDSDISSASVVSQDGGLADALSTACFVSGFKKAKQLLERFEDVEAIIITKGMLPKQVKIYKKERRIK